MFLMLINDCVVLSTEPALAGGEISYPFWDATYLLRTRKDALLKATNGQVSCAGASCFHAIPAEKVQIQ